MSSEELKKAFTKDVEALGGFRHVSLVLETVWWYGWFNFRTKDSDE